MTGNDVTEPALRLLTVLDETQNATAEQSSTGLAVLNDMMADLAGDGVDLGYAPQSDPNADIGINIESRQTLKYLLAVMLAPIYEKPVSPVIAAMAVTGRSRLLRDSIYQKRIEATMTHIPLGEGFRLHAHILTDI